MSDGQAETAASRRSPLWGWAMLVAAGIAAAGVAVVLFAAGGGSGGTAAAPAPAGTAVVREVGVIDSNHPEVGEKAPDFALVDARDGVTVRRLSDFRGRTVVLNWFASWCGPCRSEMPDFEAAYQALGGPKGDVVFLLVNLQESRAAAVGMLDDTGATYPAVLDSDGKVADHYRITGMPTTFFIDRDGVLRMFGRGRITAETLKSELAKLGHSY